MCNLYSETRNVEAIRRLFKISHNRSFDFAPKDAIFPGHTAPVIRPAADGDLELAPMSWGFVLPQPGKVAAAIACANFTSSTPPGWAMNM